MDLAKNYNPEAIPISSTNLTTLINQYKKRFAYLKNELAERSAIKYDVSLSQATSAIGIIYIVIVVAGIIHTTLLLNSLGVKTSLFFSSGDYLSASIEQIRPAAIYVSITLISIFMNIRKASLTSKMMHEINIRKKTSDIPLFFIVLSASIGNIIHAIRGEYNPFYFVFLSGILILEFSKRISAAYFSRAIQAQIFITLILLFISHIIIFTTDEILKIERGNYSDYKTMRIKLKNEQNADSLALIDASSNYLFLVDKKTREAIVLPRDQVASYTIE